MRLRARVHATLSRFCHHEALALSSASYAISPSLCSLARSFAFSRYSVSFIIFSGSESLSMWMCKGFVVAEGDVRAFHPTSVVMVALLGRRMRIPRTPPSAGPGRRPHIDIARASAMLRGTLLASAPRAATLRVKARVCWNFRSS